MLSSVCENELSSSFDQCTFLYGRFIHMCIFKRLLTLERGREAERKNIDPLPPACTLPGDRTHNPGVCPDRESDSPPLSMWDRTPTH